VSYKHTTPGSWRDDLSREDLAGNEDSIDVLVAGDHDAHEAALALLGG